ncbi:MAG: alkaline phosphatase family protein, partial [Chloroflexota bacterium]
NTGITSNSFHVTGDDFYWYRVGFDEPMEAAEPVWVTASKNGLTTAAVFFVGGSPSLRNQMADYTIGYGIEDAYSTQRTIELEPAGDWAQPPTSYSPPLEGSMTIQNVGPVFLCAIDSTDDQTSNYDAVLLNTERSGSASAQILKVGDWGSLVILPKSYSGATFLLQSLTAQQATLFQSGVNHNTASPADFLQTINEKFGFFPASADSYALEHGWINEQDFLVMLERQSIYMAEVTAWVYQTYQPDLLMTWQDNFDAAGHQFLMVDERQYDYSAEKAAAYAEYYRQAARIADQALEIMSSAFDMDRTTVFLTGDHGMAPIHSLVYVNTILENAGLLKLDSQNAVVLNQTKAFAIPSGGAVHIYINLEGREKGGGTVSAEEYPLVQAQIADLFRKLVDPDSGELVFNRVLPHEELAQLGLDHPNSGDVFAQSNPGYHLDGWRGNDYVFAQADFYGQHGYDSALPEMHTIFMAAGAGVEPLNQVIPPVRIVDYAPTIASILGFKPAPSVDGQIIPYFQP